MFTNASSVVIGGKEVQSIVTSNGGVLYQKSSPSPSTVSSISLSSSSSILSAYHSESATLTATATDSNSNPVANATVEFFNGSTSLGTSTTNSNGVATKSYSATGSGDVSLTATSGNVSSSAITVEDCIFYDTTEYSQVGGSGSELVTNKTIVATLSALPNSWELSYDYKATCESRVGLFSQANFLTQANPNYSVFTGRPASTGRWYYGYRATSTSTTDVTSTSVTDWETNKFRRNNSSTITYTRVKTNKTYTKSVSWFNSYTYYIGILGWNSGTAYAKNIKLKAL